MKYLLSIALFLFSLNSFGQNINISGTVLPAATYSQLTVNSQPFQNTNYRGLHVTINVSGYTSGQYIPHIQGLDPVSGAWYDILVGSGSNILNAAGEYVLKVYPGSGAIPGGAASDIVPVAWRVQLIGSSTPVMALSVGFNMSY